MSVDQNFRYCSSHDFHSNFGINEYLSSSKSCSAQNCNIRNLDNNNNKLLLSCHTVYNEEYRKVYKMEGSQATSK